MRNSLKKRLFAHLYGILSYFMNFWVIGTKKNNLFTVLVWQTKSEAIYNIKHRTRQESMLIMKKTK
jgi:hypothetical protein